MLQFFSWPRRRAEPSEVYEAALARIEVMDRAGYDAVWLAEHHFSDFSICPSVHLMGMAVAARTERLRIGMGVSLAAAYHPLRLAEEVALLDVLSGGRVNWGAGRGFQPGELAALGVPMDESHERFRENVEVVLAAWTHERLHYEGRWSRFDDLEVLPKPLQQPHPPTWMAATSTGAITWTASRGLDLLLDPHSSHGQIAAKWDLYHRLLGEHGHSRADRTVPMARLVAVARTDAEAEELARAGAAWTLGSYAGRPAGAPPPEDPFMPAPMASSDPVARYVDDVIVWGTPDRVVDELRRLEEEMHLGYLLAAPLGRQSFDLLTDEVLPAIA
ncbi:MAG: LLM class flavin-dependent oxidoreductase [Actinomycetota bacterium]|nr:LLM class flavin-dependent oxidoreductase [Actinomycetota bacterium]